MTVSTEGDLGDCTYMAAILHALGGTHTVLISPSTKTKARGEEGATALHRTIAPLLEAQPYIKECRLLRSDDQVDWQSALFRNQGHYRTGETLMEAHRRHLESVTGLGHGITGKSQWLTAVPDPRSEGKIIINRTGRYRNPHFDWKPVVAHYSHRLIFLGARHEWREFCSHHGYVDYLPTGNLLEVAQIIAGSEMFIGNQSSCFAVAEGLKHRRILEVSTEFPDTIFGGDNATYVADGSMTLPDIAGSGVLTVPSQAFTVSGIQTFNVPPGGWQYHSPESGRIEAGLPASAARKLVTKLKNSITQEEAERRVIAYNVERVPKFFSRFCSIPNFNRVRMALQSAGVTDHPVFDIAKGNITFNLNA